MNDERAAEGIDHLQRAAREMVAAARSFLDVVEELVEDKAALNEVASSLSGAASAVSEAVRTGLGSRPAPWETAAWDDPPWEHDTDGVHDDTDDGGADDTDDTEAWAASLAAEQDAIDVDDVAATAEVIDLAEGDASSRPAPRVRRIAVD